MIVGDRLRLAYDPQRLTVSELDGIGATTVAHESHPADTQIASVWATDLGNCYIEVMHPGDGPAGGELVVVVPGDNAIIIGDLMGPGTATPDWASALDLVLGLTNKDTLVHTSAGVVSREELDIAHQKLLTQLLG